MAIGSQRLSSVHGDVNEQLLLNNGWWRHGWEGFPKQGYNKDTVSGQGSVYRAAIRNNKDEQQGKAGPRHPA